MSSLAPAGRISVVIPVYRAEAILESLCARLAAVLQQLSVDYEILLIDDRSPDGSWRMLRQLARADPHVKAVRLSRNFGQHHAITAGLDLTNGDWTVVMDCDLQDQPEEIPRLLEVARQGYDVVLARRRGRDDAHGRRLSSRLFHACFALLSGYKLDPSVGSFRLLHRKVVLSFREMRESGRFFGGMVEWLGFSSAIVEVAHAPRATGDSSYTLRSLTRLALDAIFAFSNRPLYFSIGCGFAMSLAALLYAARLVVLYFVHPNFPVPGWASEICMTAFIGGLIMMNLGIVGIYVGRLYTQTKGRPLYVIDEVLGAHSGTPAAARAASAGR